MKKQLIRIAVVSFILVFLVFLRFELIKLNQRKTESYRKLAKAYQKILALKNKYTDVKGKRLKDFELNDLMGKPWKLEDDDSYLKVLILFNVNNCGSCLQEYLLWKKIHEKYADRHVLVLGISHTKDIEDLLYFVQERDIGFTILHDPAEKIRKSLGIKNSPLRMLLDNNNEILDVQKCDPELSLQKQVLSKIRRYLKAGQNINDQNKLNGGEK